PAPRLRTRGGCSYRMNLHASVAKVLPGCVGAMGMADVRTRDGCSYKGGLASAVVGAPVSGANRGVPGRDEHQLVRGVTGCSAPALRLQESGPAAALSSSGRSTTPPPLSRWLLGALALTGWPVFAPETGAPTKGGWRRLS